SLYSKKLANTHFWIGTLGILFYVVPMYWAALVQSSMWKSFTEEGNLKYQFMESVTTIVPMYALRAVGGAIFIWGMVLMVYNLIKTVKKGQFVSDEKAQAAPLPKKLPVVGKQHWHNWIERRPIQMLIFSLIAVAIGGILELVPT